MMDVLFGSVLFAKVASHHAAHALHKKAASGNVMQLQLLNSSYDRRKTMRGLILILIIFMFVQPASASLKKCVDNHGKFHYYDSILPDECQGKATIEMNKQGVVINRVEEAVSQSTEEDKTAHLAEAQRLAREKKEDSVLLNIYTSAEEIDLARERNIHPVELAIIGTKKRLEIAQTRLDNLQKQAKEAEKLSSPNLTSIQQDIIPTQREVANLRKELMDNQQRIENIKAKYDADKERFLVLVEKKN
jgi:hypothetical protein